MKKKQPGHSGKTDSAAASSNATVSGDKAVRFSQRELREVSFQISSRWFNVNRQARLTLLDINPWRLLAYWHMNEAMVEELQQHQGRLVLRFFEIPAAGSSTSETGINPFDIEVEGTSNNWYVYLWQPGKCYTAILGYLANGSFHELLKSSNQVKLPAAGQSTELAFKPGHFKVNQTYGQVLRSLDQQPHHESAFPEDEFPEVFAPPLLTEPAAIQHWAPLADTIQAYPTTAGLAGEQPESSAHGSGSSHPWPAPSVSAITAHRLESSRLPAAKRTADGNPTVASIPDLSSLEAELSAAMTYLEAEPAEPRAGTGIMQDGVQDGIASQLDQAFPAIDAVDGIHTAARVKDDLFKDQSLPPLPSPDVVSAIGFSYVPSALPFEGSGAEGSGSREEQAGAPLPANTQIDQEVTSHRASMVPFNADVTLGDTLATIQESSHYLRLDRSWPIPQVFGEAQQDASGPPAAGAQARAAHGAAPLPIVTLEELLGEAVFSFGNQDATNLTIRLRVSGRLAKGHVLALFGKPVALDKDNGFDLQFDLDRGPELVSLIRRKTIDYSGSN